MADDNSLKLFGFEISRAKNEKKKEQLPSIVPPLDDDGAGYVTASGSHYGQYINLDGDESKDNHQAIMKYRGVALHPEVDDAIENIINEAISASTDGAPVELNLENVDASNKIKKQMEEELHGNQDKIDADKDGKISSNDFKLHILSTKSFFFLTLLSNLLGSLTI